jgi:hypothetical protein
MICPICGKPLATLLHRGGAYSYYTVATTSTSMLSSSSEFCLGFCVGTTTTTISVNGVTLPVYDFKFETVPQTEKPLEWSEVEQQLDDFMETLNKHD